MMSVTPVFQFGRIREFRGRSLFRFPRFVKQAALLAVVALLPAVLAAVFHPKAPAWSRESAGAPEVTAAWVRARTGHVLWIDARSEASFQRDGIASAVPLNEDRWDDLMSGFIAVWQPGMIVVVYCDQHCHSSQEVARRLRRELNLKEVVVLRGGREAWAEAPAKP